ncbi:hypothetical protein AB0C34_28370 [Nocardia sp. NPDC049220]|uniref:hypothetical protein n=1 Tax=Nocardia sp. NPDC049220 TaxID=3155273 RepID=UPI0033E1C7BA
MSAADRRREQAELGAEQDRLGVVHGVLLDMAFAARDASDAKGHCDNDFEISRIRHTKLSAQVHAERIAIWGRLLDYRLAPEAAAKIRAEVAVERDRIQRESPRRMGRSR